MISITGKPTTVRRMLVLNEKVNKNRKILSIIYSSPLSDIIVKTNINSDNTYTEQLLRTLGNLKGSGGTTEAGILVVKNIGSRLVSTLMDFT